MTTAVKVQPTGHRIQVTRTGRDKDGNAVSSDKVILEPGTPEQTFYIHSSLDLTVEEISVDMQVNTTNR